MAVSAGLGSDGGLAAVEGPARGGPGAGVTCDAAVVGAGVSGLAAAVHLQRAGLGTRVFEAAEDIGGRVRTDVHGGFRLDRGFQVLLTAYPEAASVLDYRALDLRRFNAGALIWYGGRIHTLLDPRRRPAGAAASLQGVLGVLRGAAAGPADDLRVLRLVRLLQRTEITELFTAKQTTTAQLLAAAGFSERIVERFFRPFLGGVFLEPGLATASGMFGFVFKMFADGAAVLPAAGMSAIPQQLAERLDVGAITTGTRVTAVRGVTDPSGPEAVALLGPAGELCRARVVVIATDDPLPGPAPADMARVEWHAVTCLYFDAPRPPVRGPWLLLNGAGPAGRGAGPVNNVAVLSEVAPEYAPPGRALVSASVLGIPDADDERLAAQVLDQLGVWFGSHRRRRPLPSHVTGSVASDSLPDWRLLRVYRIERALPAFGPRRAAAVGEVLAGRDVAADGGGTVDGDDARIPGVFFCGDRFDTPSLNGALSSARRTAAAVAAYLR